MKRDKATLQTEGEMKEALGACRSEREGKAWSSSRAKQRHNVVAWYQPRKHAAHEHTSCFSSPPEKSSSVITPLMSCFTRKGLTKRWDCSCLRDLRNNTETLLRSPLSPSYTKEIFRSRQCQAPRAAWHLHLALG